jgi:glycine hydroxymethyltransferase
MKNILFVCTGNVCRSPMAEGLFRHAVRDRDGLTVSSAGVGAINGQPPSSHAIRAMKELGVDLGFMRSRMLTAEMVQQADYIFGMTRGHVDAIALLYPQAAEKVFLLREFDETLGPYEKDISDPIGGTLDVYRVCRDQIEQGIASLLKFMDQTAALSAETETAPAIRSLVLGADHAGYALKESVKHYLQAQGRRVVDLGTHSPDSTDYPDLARAVAREVASDRHALGLLFCKTGIGMSIAANKVQGIRAALVNNPETVRRRISS